jgi:hypothetical protein
MALAWVQNIRVCTLNNGVEFGDNSTVRLDADNEPQPLVGFFWLWFSTYNSTNFYDFIWSNFFQINKFKNDSQTIDNLPHQTHNY